jgi:NADH-quinone oxidoreductase subunit L
VGLVTAVITAFYMTRQVWLVFYSDERWRDAQATDAPDAVEAHEPAEQPHAGVHGEPHESPWTMLVPLGVLAVLSVIGGVINLPFINAELDFLGRWLAEPTLAGVEEVSPTSFLAGFVLATVALTLAIVTIVVARAIYLNGLNKDGTDPAADRLGGFAKVLANAYYLDVGLARFVSGPITAFARLLSEGIDRGTIDGAVNGIGKVTRQGSGGIRRLQTGLVRNYALAIVLGTVLLLVYVATRASF